MGTKITPVTIAKPPEAFNCCLGNTYIVTLEYESSQLHYSTKHCPRNTTNGWSSMFSLKHVDQHYVSPSQQCIRIPNWVFSNLWLRTQPLSLRHHSEALNNYNITCSFDCETRRFMWHGLFTLCRRKIPYFAYRNIMGVTKFTPLRVGK